MKLALTQRDIELLMADGINFDQLKDYSEDEALELLDLVRGKEAFYAQDENTGAQELFNQYCELGDRIFDLI